MPIPPRPRRRLVLAGIVAATTCALGGSAVVQFRADDNWRAMLTAREELQAEWNAKSPNRAVAFGEPTAGEAFVHYRQATELAQGRGASDYPSMIAMLRETDAEVATGHAELHERWRPVLDELRAGTTCGTASPLRWHGDRVEDRLENLIDCRWVANAAVFAARAARHAGRHADAVRYSLDAATFGADLMRRGLLVDQMIGGALLTIAVAEAWPDAALAQLDLPALDLLAIGLERIDRSLPESLDATGELLWLGASLRAHAPSGLSTPALSTWNYGFSARWMFADAFVRLVAAVREVEGAFELAWPQREALIELQAAALVGSGNAMLQTLVPNLVAAESSYREALAMLRLLRLAVDVHRGLDVPPLRDPLGFGPIHVLRDGGTLRFACEGADERPILARTVAR